MWCGLSSAAEAGEVKAIEITSNGGTDDEENRA